MKSFPQKKAPRFQGASVHINFESIEQRKDVFQFHYGTISMLKGTIFLFIK